MGFIAALIADIETLLGFSPQTPPPQGTSYQPVTSSSPVIDIGDIYVNAYPLGVEALAKTLWAEARGEGAIGMQAVANVVMNRVTRGMAGRGERSWGVFNNLDIGANVQVACFTRSAGGIYQFDCWRPGTANYKAVQAVTPDDPAYQTALNIAAQAVAGTLQDITGGATNYYAPSVVRAPSWATAPGTIKTADIGNHSFYIA